MAGSVRVVDRGANELIRSVARWRGPRSVRVGVIGSHAAEPKNEAPGLTVADIATFHEFGLGVPERSFIRAYIDENEAQLAVRLRRIAEVLYKQHKNPTEHLLRFGLYVVGQIKERITAGIPPENAESTRRRKARGGATTPLIDTGQLISSITSELETR